MNDPAAEEKEPCFDPGPVELAPEGSMLRAWLDELANVKRLSEENSTLRQQLSDQAHEISMLNAEAEMWQERVEIAEREVGRLQAENERLSERLAAAESVLHEIVCTEPPDDGVVLLSNEGTCHLDPERNIQVYDHVHFSPLGDALMKLYRTLKGTEDVSSQ